MHIIYDNLFNILDVVETSTFESTMIGTVDNQGWPIVKSCEFHVSTSSM